MVVSSPAVADSDVYVGSYDHIVYAFGSAPSGQPNTASKVAYLPMIAAVLIASAVVVTAAVLTNAFYKKRHK